MIGAILRSSQSRFRQIFRSSSSRVRVLLSNVFHALLQLAFPSIKSTQQATRALRGSSTRGYTWLSVQRLVCERSLPVQSPAARAPSGQCHQRTDSDLQSIKMWLCGWKRSAGVLSRAEEKHIGKQVLVSTPSPHNSWPCSYRVPDTS